MRSIDVVAALGEPDDFAKVRKRDKDYMHRSIFLYGDTGKVNLQVRIEDSVASGIWLYFRGSNDVSSLRLQLKPSEWQVSGQWKLDDFFEYADAQQLTWRLDDALCYEDSTAVRISTSQAVAIWDHDSEADPTSPYEELDKIMLDFRP